MTPQQLQEIKDSLKQTVEQTVNGKLDAIRFEQKKVSEDLKNYITQDNTDKKKIIDWQENATPSLVLIEKMQGFASVGSTILKTVVLVGATVSAVWGIIKLFKIR